jgi:hypothetical protein
MIKFECDFECKTEQEVIYALQHIIDRIECGYKCGYLTESSAEGDWGMSGEEEEEEETRTIRVKWNVARDDMDWEVPVSIENDEIADWLHSKYGWKVEWLKVIENGEVVYSWG